MARATWSGAISFGLVSVPVKLFTAVRSHSIRFREIHKGTNARVEHKRVDAETGEEVPYDEIVKGYEVDDGRFVIVDPDELGELDPDATRLIDIRDFVELHEIDPIYFDRPYYLVPDGQAALKPYRLLAAAMERSDRVAIASFVMRTKEYLAAIRARDGILLLSTMHHADEVADPSDLDVEELGADVELHARELEMAQDLIDKLATSFDPTAYEDEYHDRVIAFLEKKAAGEKIEVTPPERDRGGVVDLMAALEESLQRAEGGRGAPDLDEMSREELYELAQERDLPGRSSMSKAELVKALRAGERKRGAA